MENSLEPGFLSACRVAILGLGLMGGSLALALKGHCASIMGIDPDGDTLRLASEMGLADQFSADPKGLLPEADLIVLAAPVRTNLRLLAEIPRLHPGRAVILDLSSTKVEIMRAMKGLPERFDPVGGHPMCGKERSLLSLAEAMLFQKAAFALIALARTSPSVRRLAEELVRGVGAEPVWMEAEAHDRWVAATSHLPYLAANCLAAVTPAEAAPLAGPGFRSTTRLAVSPLPVMLDVLATNRDNILQTLDSFQKQLGEVRRQLAEQDDGELARLLAMGAERQQELTGHADSGGKR